MQNQCLSWRKTPPQFLPHYSKFASVALRDYISKSVPEIYYWHTKAEALVGNLLAGASLITVLFDLYYRYNAVWILA